MPPVSAPDPPINAAIVARHLAQRLESQGQDYALGGAIALSYWGLPRATADVEGILRTQGTGFDYAWVRVRLAEMYGPLDPRLSEWENLVRETR